MLSQSLGNLVVHLRGNTTQYTAAMTAAQNTMRTTASKIQAFGTKMSAAVSLPLAIVGGMSVSAFAKFDEAMTQSLAIMGDVGEGMRQEMEDTVKALSGKSIKSPEELARSYFYLASAGLSAKQSIEALATVEKFAVAGAFDMALATDLLTDAQSALGLTVQDSVQNMMNMKRMSDVLVKANTLANASVEQFSIALTSKAATAMKSYNIKLEEGVAVLAAYADQGIKAQYAGNMFDRMIRLLIKSVNDNEEAFQRMNIQTRNASGDLLPLYSIIKDITLALDGMGATQKAAALELLGFEARSQQAILPLLGLSEQIKNYQRQLEQANDITRKVAEKQFRSFSAQMKILVNNLKLAGIEIGGHLAPTIMRLSGVVQSATEWFRGLNASTQQTIVGIGSVTAVTGIALLVFGWLAKSVLSIVGVLKLVSAVSIKFVAVALLVVAAVTAVIDAFTGGKLGFLEFVKAIRLGGLKIGTYFDMITSYLVQAWEWASTSVILAWETWKFSMMELGAGVYRNMLKIAQGVAKVWAWVTGSTAANFDKMINQSLEKSAQRAEKLRGQFKGAATEMNSRSEMWEQVRKGILNEDLLGDQSKATGKADNKNGLAPQMKAIAEAAKNLNGTVKNVSGSAGPAAMASQKSFETMSLRRFSLSPVGTPRQDKQEVRDEAAVSELQQIKDLLKSRSATALLE